MEVYYAAKNGERVGDLHQSKEGVMKDLICFLEYKENITKLEISLIVPDIRWKDWADAANGNRYSIKSETVLP